MKLLATALFLFVLTGCVVRDKVPITTQVVTFPEGALVEFNNKRIGRAPAAVVLPQDSNGRLTERTILRAIPNTAQTTLMAQSRVLEPGERAERVPDKIMIDLRLADPTVLPALPASQNTPVLSPLKPATPTRRRVSDRSKPTQPVGIDRWNPGIY